MNPRSRIPVGSQASQRIPMQNNTNILNTQNMLGRTVQNTVYQSQAQNGKRSNSLNKTANANGKSNVNINSQANKNSAVNPVNNSKTVMLQQNASNKLGGLAQTQKNALNTANNNQANKSTFNRTIVKDGKTLSNIDTNNQTQASLRMENEKLKNKGSQMNNGLNLLNNPTVASVHLDQSKQANSTLQSQNQKLPTLSQQIKYQPNGQSQAMKNNNIPSQKQSIQSVNSSLNTQKQSIQSINPSQNLQRQSINNPSQINQQSMNPQLQSIHPQQSKFPQQSMQSQQSMHPQQSKLPQQSMQSQQSMHPQQSKLPQQSMHPQQSSHPQQSKLPQQSMHPQQSSHPQQSMHSQQSKIPQQSMHSVQPGNQSMNPQKQSINNQKDSNEKNNNSDPKLSRKSTLRASRNKSPPQIIRTPDGKLKRSGADFSGNHYYVTTDNEKIVSDSYIGTHLNEYLNNEIANQMSQNTKPKNNKVGNGFRFYGQLTKAGRNQNGKTKTDQDTPLVHLNVGDIPGFNLFGVLDGHGPDGHFVSQFCREYFINKMTSYAQICKQNKLTTPEAIYNELKRTKFAYIIDVFNKADSEMSKQNKFDFNFSGTTCNISFQFNKYLVNASVGDSRGIIVFDTGDSKNQGIQPTSTDHKPDLPGELDRIKMHGGVVDKITDSFGNKVGPQRVWKAGLNYPGLAMSRSLGDFQAKECGVISSPQIVEYTISSRFTKYLCICSDGVWEFIQNEQVRDLGNAFLIKNDVGGFCSELVKFAVHSWEQFDIIRDDITVVCVFF